MFRRSGSVTLLRFAGELPAPGTPAFTNALAKQRFRTIEHAASEESSVGWVTQADPTGDSFAPDAIEFDGAWWLRLRFDRKTLPLAWVRIYRVAAEASAGRRLSPRERKELRADLCDKLLPRILPAVRFVDVLIQPREQRVLLFSTSRAAREAFGRIFEQSFDVRAETLGPRAFAEEQDLAPAERRQLDELRPVRWPRAHADAAAAAAAQEAAT
jgi:DNA recombination-dependent growth factor C